jgi:MFS family permease
VETPALPLFVTRQAHGSTLDAGIVAGTLTFSSMLARPLVAQVTRRAGTPVTLLATSFLTAAVLAAYPWVHSVPVLAALRAAEGIGHAGFLVAGITAACAIAPAGREGAATSFFTSVNSLSLVGGSLIAGWLLTLGGYRATWLAAAGLAVAGGSAAAAAGRGGRPAAVTPRARLRLLHPAAVRPGATLALGVLPAGGFFALAPLYAGRAGLSPAAVMALFGGVIFAARTIGAGSAAAGAAAPAAALLLQARRERPAP